MNISENRYVMSLVLFAIAACLLFIAARQRADKKEKQRRDELKKDYPELISRLLLYLQAGIVPDHEQGPDFGGRRPDDLEQRAFRRFVDRVDGGIAFRRTRHIYCGLR